MVSKKWNGKSSVVASDAHVRQRRSMREWLHDRLLSLLGVGLVSLVAIGTIGLAPTVARGLEQMPWLIYMHTGGQKPAWFLGENDTRERADPLPLDTVGVTGEDLRALGLPVAPEASLHPVELEGTFPSGHFVTEAADATVMSARRAIWSWDAGRPGVGVEVKVVELVAERWASSLARVTGGKTPGPGDYPEGALVFHQAEDGDEPYAMSGAQFVHGRLFVVVQVGVGSAYLAEVEAGASPPLDTVELARQVSLKASEALPLLPDLAGWERLPMADLRPLHAASFGLAAFLTLLVRELGATILDRGSREAIGGRWRQLEPRAWDADLRRPARRARAKALMRTLLLAVGVGCGAIVYYFASAPVTSFALSIGMPGFLLDFIVATLIAVTITVVTVLTRRGSSATGPLSAGWRRAEATAAALSTVILAGGIFWIGWSGIGFATGDAMLVRVLSLVMLVVGLAIVSFAPYPARLLQRLAMPHIKQSLAQDDRPPVLFLRSFEDDDLRIRIRSASRSGVTERLGLLNDSTFEDLVAWIASRLGPVIAIGQPGTVLQPLGAARDYFDDDEWQTAVLKRINVSKAIVYLVGRSPGAQWELAQIRDRGALGRTIFVFPPVDAEEFVGRCLVLAAGLRVHPTEFYGDIDTGAPLAAVRVDAEGRVVRYLVDGRDDLAYSLALGRALDDAAAQREIVAGVADPYVDSELQEEAASLLVTYDPTRRKRTTTDPFRRAVDFFLTLTRPFV